MEGKFILSMIQESKPEFSDYCTDDEGRNAILFFLDADKDFYSYLALQTELTDDFPTGGNLSDIIFDDDVELIISVIANREGISTVELTYSDFSTNDLFHYVVSLEDDEEACLFKVISDYCEEEIGKNISELL
jgi:hypothetical protein